MMTRNDKIKKGMRRFVRDMRSKLEAFVEQFAGQIVSYEDVSGSSTSRKMPENGMETQLLIGHVGKILMADGRAWSLQVYAYHLHPDSWMLGVAYVRAIDGDGMLLELGAVPAELVGSHAEIPDNVGIGYTGDEVVSLVYMVG